MRDFAHWNRNEWRAFIREVNPDLPDAEFARLWDQFMTTAMFRRVEGCEQEAA